MSLSVQQITIRLGLSLQACVEYSVTEHLPETFSYTASYDDESIVPDFVFKLRNRKIHVMEVTNTDARDSLRMKVLRYLELVAEVKSAYGADCVCTSLVLGNADTELPANNIRAMTAFFDAYACVQNAVASGVAGDVRDLEIAIRKMSEDTKIKGVEIAAKQICAKHPRATKAIAEVVGALLRASPKAEWNAVWNAEISRRATLTDCIPEIDGFGLKRAVIDSLLLGQIPARQVIAGQIPRSTLDVLKCLGLITESKSIRGNVIRLRADIARLYEAPELLALRNACIERLASSTTSTSIMDDILDDARRKKMCETFLSKARTKVSLAKAIIQSYTQTEFEGIRHGRCWIADLVPLAQDTSHNKYNSLLIAHDKYSSSLANPYPNIVIKSGFSGSRISDLARIISEIYFDNGGTPSGLTWEHLSARLLKFRRASLIKLHSVNPLRILIDEWARSNAVEVTYTAPPNIVSSFLDDETGTAEYKVVVARQGGKCIYINAVYVDEYGGLDKAKEWSARGRALQYRFEGKDVVGTQIDGMLFVADGHWKPKALARLMAGGWTVTTPSRFPETACAMLSTK